ncbi:MAG: nucleotide sugar dehydrogenase, partial [Fibrobacterota bacterium]
MDTHIAVVGLGYVGLPLAVHLDHRFKVTGFDINRDKIADLQKGLDEHNEFPAEVLARSTVHFTAEEQDLSAADILIIAVPTPIDIHKIPDLAPLLGATRLVGRNMQAGATVVYESTVFPGTTENHCIPLLEEASGLTWKQHFSVGYSPERINPGDSENTFSKIIKIVAGDSPETTNRLADIYGAVITAGIHRAQSIKVAEAAKVIENTQRDINIAVVNEFRIIFDKMGISTKAVLAAAGT